MRFHPFLFLFCIILKVRSSFQVLWESIHITLEYLSQEAKVTSAMSRVEALEVENSKLKKDLISTMDEANTVKEKVKVLRDDLRAERQLTLEKDEQLQATKEKIKTVAAKSVKALQQTKDYNTMLFSWYYKGFDLLRQYLVKHPSRVDLENLDLEEVDQEMVADEPSQSTTATPIGDTPGDASLPHLLVMTQPPLKPAYVPASCLPTLFFFFGCPVCVFGLFILFLEQYFYSNLRTMSLAQCFWAFNSIDYYMFTCLLSCIVVHDTFLLYVIFVCFVVCVCLLLVRGFV